MFNLKNQANNKIYSIIGNNGMVVTNNEAVLLEALHTLVYATVSEMPTEEMAIRYAYSAYFQRFLMRNFSRGIAPLIPRELPIDYIFLDPDYDEREGNKTPLSPFPGLPM